LVEPLEENEQASFIEDLANYKTNAGIYQELKVKVKKGNVAIPLL
jgi:hypothetical protein